MFNLAKSKLPLAIKFYLMLVLPLILVSIAVTVMSFQGLQDNAKDLADVLRIESKTNRILSLLLVQDDASKAILIDPSQLERFSSKKIEAYDDHKKLLIELQQEAGSTRFQDLLRKLQEIDEQKLRPIDSMVLEKLYENVDEARRMYFEYYELHKKEYETLIRELVRLGAEDLREASVELHRNNLRSLIQISVALFLGILLVITAINLLSREVGKSERNTQSLLAVLSEGLFFFDEHGVIADERSQTLTKILPDSGSIKSLQDFVDRYKPSMSRNVPMSLRMLWNHENEDFLSDMTSVLSLLPKEFILDGGKVIQLDYRPLRNDRGNLRRIVVVVADVTRKLEQEREATLQAERVRKISKVAAHVDDYLTFLEESTALFQDAQAIFENPTRADKLQLKRDLHTLKGALATAEFNTLATAFHELETLIEEEGFEAPAVWQRWESIRDRWLAETSDIAQSLGLDQRFDSMAIARAKFESLRRYARLQKDRDLQNLLDDCLRLPAREVLGKYQSQVEKLAEKLGGKEVGIIFKSDSTDLAPAEVQKLDGSFIHILRNCVDHGIETSAIREQKGKPAKGRIEWGVYRKDSGSLHIVIGDDGQGVDGDRLAAKAVRMGHWTEAKALAASAQDKIELLFLPELSSRDEVSEWSGRGVGMDAVKELVEKLGGTILVHSQPGLGTRFEITIPSPERADDTLRRSA